VTATRLLSGEARESARRSRMYRAALGWMWDWRFERSDVNVEALDDIVPLGTTFSFWMVARMPRWEDEVMRVPRADLSS
jgi:hypothetical protein